ncbi:hypothetical protein Tco_0773845 [Tanacetum coccineum]|uniref:Uncharacterized protein n=1 Tax=Tanacetum coccineum TaxID=301880 RepID=A0ABQ4ZLX3_9ASTR
MSRSHLPNWTLILSPKYLSNIPQEEEKYSRRKEQPLLLDDDDDDDEDKDEDEEEEEEHPALADSVPPVHLILSSDHRQTARDYTYHLEEVGIDLGPRYDSIGESSSCSSTGKDQFGDPREAVESSTEKKNVKPLEGSITRVTELNCSPGAGQQDIYLLIRGIHRTGNTPDNQHRGSGFPERHGYSSKRPADRKSQVVTLNEMQQADNLTEAGPVD